MCGPELLGPQFNLERIGSEEERVCLPRPVEADPPICLTHHRHALKEIAPERVGAALDALPPR